MKLLEPTLRERNNEKVEEFNTFIENIKPNDKVAIFHDNDLDGTTSATLLKIFLETKGIKPTLHFDKGKSRALDEQKIDLLKDYNKIFILDLAFQNFEETLELAINKELCIIDHHVIFPIQEIEKSKNIHVINSSQFIDSKNASMMCTASMVYLLTKPEIVKDKENNWERDFKIVAVGIIADVAYPLFIDALNKFFNNKNLRNNEDIYKSEFGTIVNTLNLALVETLDNIPSIIDILQNSKTIEELKEKSKKYEYLNEELNRLINDFKENKKTINKNLISYYINSKYNFGSTLSNIISNENRNSVHMLLTEYESEKLLKGSFRCQGKNIHCGRLATIIREQIENGTGGGHIPAAGFAIPLNKTDELIELLNKIFNNKDKYPNIFNKDTF